MTCWGLFTIIGATRVLVRPVARRFFLQVFLGQALPRRLFLGELLQIVRTRGRYHFFLVVLPADRDLMQLHRVARSVLQEVLTGATLGAAAVFAVAANQTISFVHVRLHLAR